MRHLSAWPTARLADVASIASGNSMSATERAGKYAAALSTGRPFISTKDVGVDGRVNMSPDVVIPREATPNFRLAPKDSTLVCSEGGSAGRKVGYVEQSVHYGNKLFAVSARAQLDPKFLHYFLLSEDFSSQFRARLTGLIGGVSLKKFQSIETPVPPLDQQKRIVRMLDQALADLEQSRIHSEANVADLGELTEVQFDLAVSGTFCDSEPAAETVERLLEELKERRKKTRDASMFGLPDAFFERPLRKGWRWVPLGDLASRISDGVHKTPSYVENGIPFITVKNLTAGSGISFSGTKFITQEDHDEFIKRTHPEQGDILISKDGTIGVVRKIQTNQPFSIFVSVALVKLLDYRLSDYLTIALQAPSVQAQIVPKGAALKHLYLNDLRRLPIPLGPLTDLCRTVSRMGEVTSALKQLRLIFQEKIQDHEALRQALLRKAFSGQLA